MFSSYMKSQIFKKHSVSITVTQKRSIALHSNKTALCAHGPFKGPWDRTLLLYYYSNISNYILKLKF